MPPCPLPLPAASPSHFSARRTTGSSSRRALVGEELAPRAGRSQAYRLPRPLTGEALADFPPARGYNRRSTSISRRAKCRATPLRLPTAGAVAHAQACTSRSGRVMAMPWAAIQPTRKAMGRTSALCKPAERHCADGPERIWPDGL
jgi:hypothetical protein